MEKLSPTSNILLWNMKLDQPNFEESSQLLEKSLKDQNVSVAFLQEVEDVINFSDDHFLKNFKFFAVNKSNKFQEAALLVANSLNPVLLNLEFDKLVEEFYTERPLFEQLFLKTLIHRTKQKLKDLEDQSLTFLDVLKLLLIKRTVGVTVTLFSTPTVMISQHGFSNKLTYDTKYVVTLFYISFWNFWAKKKNIKVIIGGDLNTPLLSKHKKDPDPAKQYNIAESNLIRESFPFDDNVIFSKTKPKDGRVIDYFILPSEKLHLDLILIQELKTTSHFIIVGKLREKIQEKDIVENAKEITDQITLDVGQLSINEKKL